MAWGRDSFDSGHWGPVCFTAQQIAEKCLKAVAIARGAVEVRGHSLAKIAEALGINGDIEKMARRLDVYYITTRYPDAFSEGAPMSYFDEEQAAEALSFAARFIEIARKELAPGG
jgi:HEPN domain-containing protein